jgi:pimeloyl-ACP methyl ester carboxylesterase
MPAHDAPAAGERAAGPSGERFCVVGDVRLCYETFGDPADPTVLLIMGLGTQMLGWDAELCALLAGRGLHVVRFDNRDCGRSGHHGGPVPSRLALATRRIRRPAYTLADLAADAAGLLDHLRVHSAHVVGASMGGMIAQTLAARHPDRVRSLVSIMSSTGSLCAGQPSPRLWRALLAPLPPDEQGYVDALTRAHRLIASPAFPHDAAALRSLLLESHRRGVVAGGFERQLAAIFHAGDRTRELRTIRAPTLVVHGTADRLIPPSGGRATARAIRDARLMLLEGMGHDLPRPLWPRLVEAIAGHALSPSAPEPHPAPQEHRPV